MDKDGIVWKGDVPIISPGFSVGIISDLRLNKYFNLRFVPVLNFGKHKGNPVEDVFRTEPSYYAWMMNGDFTLDTKKVITDIKLKMR